MVRGRPRVVSSTSSSGMSDAEKWCTGCERQLPTGSFYGNQGTSLALSSKCKECIREVSARNRAKRADNDLTPEEGEDEPESKRPRVSEPAASDLYIMALSFDPDGTVHGLKVGRSGNIPQRTLNLAASLPFTMLLLTTFPGAGDVEDAVHNMLAHCRNKNGRGREWFHASLSSVLHAVGCALQSRPKVNGSGGASSTEQ